VRDGVVTVAGGRIVEVQTASSPRSEVQDLGNVALLPGLVNAHTHLEFSLLERPLGGAGMPFPDWIGEVVAARRGLAEKMSAEELADYRRRGAETGLRESRAAGVAALGEIATMPWDEQCFTARPEVSATIFLELLGLAPERIEPFLELAERHVLAGAGVRRGLSPHAPYTVNPELLRRVCELSASRQIPLAMHVAESFEELELLRSQSGPLVERLGELGAWHPGALPRGLRPLDYLEMLSAAHRVLVIHGNFLVREEMEFLAERHDRMRVVYCPRTQAWFPFGEYPLAAMLACGLRVAVGTDSRASNPDLSVLSELRHIAQHHPAVASEEILKMGTLHGAEALGLANELGSLTPGKRAAFAVVRFSDAGNEPYDFLFQEGAPTETLPI
jgi:cytosine/adenosine deaminase-related metal-dependent hydrolase